MSRTFLACSPLAVLGFLLIELFVPASALADGSQSYTTPGSYTFTVPAYSTLAVTVNGGGGGGGAGEGLGNTCYTGGNGSSGGTSSFGSSVVGSGGGGGEGGQTGGSVGGKSEVPGSPGTASGGTTNTTGGGGASGAAGSGTSGLCNNNGTAGGSGGQATITYSAGQLTPGANITVVIGSGGAGGSATANSAVQPPGSPGQPGSSGATGSIAISWTTPVLSFTASPTSGGAPLSVYFSAKGSGVSGSDQVAFGDGQTAGITGGSCHVQQTGVYCTTHAYASAGTYDAELLNSSGSVIATQTISVIAPSCQVTISPDPSAYAYSGTPVTLSWSSSNADEVYINNIGWVGTSGSTQVASQSNTDYSCYGYSSMYGTGSWYSASLTVSPPPSPAATIAASSTSVQAGQSTNITADFSAGSGAELTADNIDSPLGTGLGANTNPGASKTITFSTSTPGTYTFYARATTDYYSSWLTLASTSVTVEEPPPSCTLSASPGSITQGQSSTLSWSCQSATSCTGANFSTGGAANGSTQVSPTQTTTYGGSCTGPGGTSNFNSNVEVIVSCEESWSCNGDTIVQTNTDCSTTNLATCNAPEYCQSGSEICLAPQISFNASGNYTGHLQVVPNLVQPGESTRVHWNVSDAQYCTVTGTNGDSWTGLASPGNGEPSEPIVAPTTYTLFCEAYADNPNVTETQTVDLTPTYQEL